jgi:hypothetical protein
VLLSDENNTSILVDVSQLDAAQAYCEATARVGSYMQELKITFPSAYPHSAPPSFHLPPNGTITTRTRNKLKEVHRTLIASCVSCVSCVSCRARAKG